MTYWDDQLLLAVKSNGSLQRCSHLINQGANVNTTTFMERKTPLHITAELGKFSICKLLIQNGADIHAKDNYGKTPYDLAKEKNEIQIKELLKAHIKANISKKIRDNLNDIEL
jgi:ankyrin repeat protein